MSPQICLIFIIHEGLGAMCSSHVASKLNAENYSGSCLATKKIFVWMHVCNWNRRTIHHTRMHASCKQNVQMRWFLLLFIQLMAKVLFKFIGLFARAPASLPNMYISNDRTILFARNSFVSRMRLMEFRGEHFQSTIELIKNVIHFEFDSLYVSIFRCFVKRCWWWAGIRFRLHCVCRSLRAPKSINQFLLMMLHHLMWPNANANGNVERWNKPNIE